MKEAMLYHRLESDAVLCDLCLQQCKIRPGRKGICGVRANRKGTLYTLVDDRLAVIGVDPIEKKPFFHFHPGSAALSIATVGCNMVCTYCQNHHLSQMPKGRKGRIIGDSITPQEIVEAAEIRRCRSIAYTYTEPTVSFELVYETARLAHGRGLKNLLVTNGYMSPLAVRMLRPYLDGASVDLKGFDDRKYKQVCGAKLRPVLEFIQFAVELGVWVEVTTLVIPGYNDSDDELRSISDFLTSVSYGIPWHVSAFFPAYKMTHLPPTPVETVHKAYAIGRNAGLHYVYCGNIPATMCATTFCPQCRTMLIERSGFTVLTNRITAGHCPDCGVHIDGVEMDGSSSRQNIGRWRETPQESNNRTLAR